MPPLVRLSLFTIQLVASATLIRSIIYDRWVTVVASLALLAGAAAVQRGKTWGVGLALGAAAAFPTAWAIGIAPAWFCVVGAVGAMPFALTSRALARFDAAATALGAAVATTTGLLGAVAWRAFAPAVFARFPEFAPSALPTNAGLAALTTVTILSILLTRRQDDDGAGASAPAPLPFAAPLPAPARARVAGAAPEAGAPLGADEAYDDDATPALPRRHSLGREGRHQRSLRAFGRFGAGVEKKCSGLSIGALPVRPRVKRGRRGP